MNAAVEACFADPSATAHSIAEGYKPGPWSGHRRAPLGERGRRQSQEQPNPEAGGGPHGDSVGAGAEGVKMQAPTVADRLAEDDPDRLEIMPGA